MCRIANRRFAPTKSDAGTRTHSKNPYKSNDACLHILCKAARKGDASSHPVFYDKFHFVFFFWFVALVFLVFEIAKSGTRSFCPMCSLRGSSIWFSAIRSL